MAPIMSDLSKSEIDLIISFKKDDLNFLINHHNYIHGLLSTEYKNLADNKDAQSNLKMHDELNTKNTFLLAYALFEELIVVVAKIKKIQFLENNDFFQKHKNVFTYLKIDPSKSDYCKLKKISKVRHCLMHCNGNLSLYKTKKEELEKFAKEQNLLLRNNLIAINKDFLQEYVRLIHLLLENAQN